MRRDVLKLLALVASFGVALGLTGSAIGGSENHPRGGTLVFAGAADPVTLDPVLVSDGESLRVARQLYEGLMTVKLGTSEVQPHLATGYKTSKDGKTWTFSLRRNVKFHDGTPFNAQAVCFNFKRWYNFQGPFQAPDATYYWQQLFGGFRSTIGNAQAPEALRTSLYKGCRAVNRHTVRIMLTKRSGSFLGSLALANFSFSSPKALRQYQADQGEIRNGIFRPTGTYGFQHPTGTGPFKFESWAIGNRLVLVRNNNYWGEKSHVQRLIIRPVSNNAARLQALQTGEIQGYDLVEPQDMPTVRGNARLRLLDRPAFNVAYVGIDQTKPPMNRLAVRQAVAYGLDRSGVVGAFYAGRAQVAHAFMPSTLFGYSKDVTKYNYDPERSKRLLQQAGLSLPVRIEFWYPTAVSRPYMPDPRANFQAFAASLERAGFQVVARAAPWRPDYLGNVQAGTAGHLHLLGWTGDFGDPDNFVGTFFQKPNPQFGFNNPKLHRLLDRAEREINQKKRIQLYQQANKMIMQFLPGIPYAHSRPGLGFDRRVRNYTPSPVSIEPFSRVFFGGV
jgi:peptide/nickel transport system substrate-binding protein